MHARSGDFLHRGFSRGKTHEPTWVEGEEREGSGRRNVQGGGFGQTFFDSWPVSPSSAHKNLTLGCFSGRPNPALIDLFIRENEPSHEFNSYTRRSEMGVGGREESRGWKSISVFVDFESHPSPQVCQIIMLFLIIIIVPHPRCP